MESLVSAANVRNLLSLTSVEVTAVVRTQDANLRAKMEWRLVSLAIRQAVWGARFFSATSGFFAE